MQVMPKNHPTSTKPWLKCNGYRCLRHVTGPDHCYHRCRTEAGYGLVYIRLDWSDLILFILKLVLPVPRLSHRLLASALTSIQHYLPGPPCPTGKQAHGHPSATLTASLKTATPGNGRTGPNESRYCCCGSSGYSCCDSRNAGSAEYCSRNRPESRAGFALARSLAETDPADYRLPQPRCLGMLCMPNPTLYRGIQGRPVYLSFTIHTAHVS